MKEVPKEVLGGMYIIYIVYDVIVGMYLATINLLPPKIGILK